MINFVQGLNHVLIFYYRLLQMCLNTLNNGISSKKAKKKPDEVFQDCFFGILKVFLNLTHNFGKILCHYEVYSSLDY